MGSAYITYRGESIFIHLSQPFNKFPITGICTVRVLSLQIILRDLLFVYVMWLPELFYLHPEFSLKNSYSLGMHSQTSTTQCQNNDDILAIIQ